jgi:hypothetical protein
MKTVQSTAAFDKPLEQLPDGIPFVDMTRTQKCVYVTKVVICIATFGFAFPHV